MSRASEVKLDAAECRKLLEEIVARREHGDLRLEEPSEIVPGRWRCKVVMRTTAPPGGRRVRIRGDGDSELAAWRSAVAEAKVNGLF